MEFAITRRASWNILGFFMASNTVLQTSTHPHFADSSLIWGLPSHGGPLRTFLGFSWYHVPQRMAEKEDREGKNPKIPKILQEREIIRAVLKLSSCACKLQKTYLLRTCPDINMLSKKILSDLETQIFSMEKNIQRPCSLKKDKYRHTDEKFCT